MATVKKCKVHQNDASVCYTVVIITRDLFWRGRLYSSHVDNYSSTFWSN